MNEKSYKAAERETEVNIINWENLNQFKQKNTAKLSSKIDLIDLMDTFRINEDWETSFIDKRDNHLIYG